MKKSWKSRLGLLALAAVALSMAQAAYALTNGLATVQATTGNINAAADTGITTGLALLGVGVAIGGLAWGLRTAFKKRPTLAILGAGYLALQCNAFALTNDLSTIQATTGNINAAADTGITTGLALLGVGVAIGGLAWGLRTAFKKRPTL